MLVGPLQQVRWPYLRMELLFSHLNNVVRSPSIQGRLPIDVKRRKKEQVKKT
ncbi:hypothetical protein [Legionella qingyii]|uniref:hypothetical protein n=1 Tax=Legionella qingyii TaxID=2184757 RepID=UPI00140264A2|nr:hypothetical protein [Legionella qingyii]